MLDLPDASTINTWAQFPLAAMIVTIMLYLNRVHAKERERWDVLSREQLDRSLAGHADLGKNFLAGLHELSIDHKTGQDKLAQEGREASKALLMGQEALLKAVDHVISLQVASMADMTPEAAKQFVQQIHRGQ